MALLSAAKAAGFVAHGGVIAYPTEGVYGLGCDPFNEAAVDAVRELKGRPPAKGMIAIVASLADLDTWVDWSGIDRQSIVECWPGPVTWVLPATEQAPETICADGAIAVRVPAHGPMLELLTACGCALVSTSANPSDSPPATTPNQIRQYFGNAVPIVEGPLGGRQQPTEIRNARSGQVLRKG